MKKALFSLIWLNSVDPAASIDWRNNEAAFTSALHGNNEICRAYIEKKRQEAEAYGKALDAIDAITFGILLMDVKMGCPDLSRGAQQSWGILNHAPENGWVYAQACGGRIKGILPPYLSINGRQTLVGFGDHNTSASIFLPVRAGDTYIGTDGSETQLMFFPCQGNL
jgi:hypothetical protein